MKYLLCGFAFGLLFGCCEPAKDLSSNLDALKKTLRESSENIRDAQEHTTSAVAENSATLREIRQKISELNQTVESKIPYPQAAQTEPQTPEPPKPEETPASDRPDDHAPPDVVPVRSAGVPLYVSITFGCAPCERLKADHAAGKFDGFQVIYSTDWQPRVYPAIRYPTAASKTGWGVIYGYDGQPTIDRLKRFTSKTATTQSSVMSHSDMVAMHNELHGGGNWTWPGDLATHLQRDHGVQTDGVPFNPSGDAIAGQPVLIRPVSRWLGFDWLGRDQVSRSAVTRSKTKIRSYRVDF